MFDGQGVRNYYHDNFVLDNFYHRNKSQMTALLSKVGGHFMIPA